MQILINGQKRQLNDQHALAEVLQHLGYQGDRFAVAVNGEFVARGAYADVTLREGDKLDVVAPVVGG